VIAVADAQSEAPAGPPGAWAAPARDLPTTVPGGGWRMVSGTSFAAGEVSGLLAVMDQAQARADGRAALPRLVRLPGGGIDACASLLNAAQRANGSGGAGPGCPALLAMGAASPGSVAASP
jgi:hypothetical protein